MRNLPALASLPHARTVRAMDTNRPASVELSYQPIAALQGPERWLGVEVFARVGDLAGERWLSAAVEEVATGTARVLQALPGWVDGVAWPCGTPELVTVNVDPRVADQNLIEHVAAAIEGLGGVRLGLEVSEAHQLGSGFVELLEECAQMGAQLLCDDLGAGWADLSRLAAVPWDWVKADRGALREETKAWRLARISTQAGWPTICEGIETSEDLDVARILGAVGAQGYLLGRPTDWTETGQ